jgi:hypothetical protein
MHYFFDFLAFKELLENLAFVELVEIVAAEGREINGCCWIRRVRLVGIFATHGFRLSSLKLQLFLILSLLLGLHRLN